MTNIKSGETEFSATDKICPILNLILRGTTKVDEVYLSPIFIFKRALHYIGFPETVEFSFFISCQKLNILQMTESFKDYDYQLLSHGP